MAARSYSFGDPKKVGAWATEAEPGSEVALPEESASSQQASTPWYKRQDLWVWIGGLVFIGAITGAMYGAGIARNWSADSGYTHNDSVTSQERFLPEPDPPEEGVRGRYGPEATARWYYWKVKPENLTFWTHFFPWACYLSHQILIWAVIYRAQMAKALEPGGKGRYRPELSVFSWISFALNIIFHILHLAQTHITYDALAQDVSISTSQASVIMLLTLVFMMEYRERGLLFGWPTTQHKDKISKRLRLNYGPINLLRRYHGYAFAWAAIYTFWYHPMENTVGHAMGFIYTWLIMLQGTLMYTPLHLNKWWRLLLEGWVIVHGGVVAAQTGGTAQGGTRLWPMFTFGFLLVFVITQIFSLPFWDRLHAIFHPIPFLAYMGVVVWSYSWIRDADGRAWVRMQEIIRIPSVYYLYFIVGWLILMAFLAIERKVQQSDASSSPSNEKAAGRAQSPAVRALWLSAAMLVYGVHIGLAIVVEYADVKMGLIVLMIMFVGIFMLGVMISSMCLKQVIPYRISPEDQNEDKVPIDVMQKVDTPESDGNVNLGADVKQ